LPSRCSQREAPSEARRARRGPSRQGWNVAEDRFEELLHPVISENSYQLYQDGHSRDAVLNSIIAVYDYIRQRTKSDDDGDGLIGKVFSLEDPLLTLSELQTESGRNDQRALCRSSRVPIRASGIRRRTASRMT
jgi:hypothetical protein